MKLKLFLIAGIVVLGLLLVLQRKTISNLTEEKAALESELIKKGKETVIVYDPTTGKKVSETTKESYEKQKTKKESSKVVNAPRLNHLLGSYGRGIDASSSSVGITYLRSVGVFEVGLGTEVRTDWTQPEAKVFLGVSF